jgi:nitroreductase
MALSGKVDYHKVLEEIMGSRRTIRRFTQQAPPKDMVERVVRAGLMAPYSGLGVSREDFRRVIVVSRDSSVMAQATVLLKRSIRSMRQRLEQEMQHDSLVRSRGQAYLKVLQMAEKEDVPILAKAPYYLVVAEERAIPHVEHCSLAHCLQNMWLEATALGLGFQLMTATQGMSDHREFSELLGLPAGVYMLDGCLLGYAAETPAPVKRPDPSRVVTWL